MKLNYSWFYGLLLFARIISAQDLNGYELNSIIFEGNKQIPSHQLKRIILSVETPFRGWQYLNAIYYKMGSPPVYFDSANIKSDLFALKAFYNANGYFKSKFSFYYIPDHSGRSVTLFYGIDEGEPSRYGTVEYNGLQYVPDSISQRVCKSLDIDSNGIFNQSKLENNIASVLTLFFNNGYMSAKYDSTLISIDTTNNRTNLELFFSPGNRFTISDIIVNKYGDGKNSVSDTLIKKFIAISPGEYYNLDKIKTGRERILKSGLFTSFKLAEVKTDTNYIYVPLKFEGSIGNMNELSPELVMNNDKNAFNFGIRGLYARKNFLGEARKLTFNAEFVLADIFNQNLANIFRTAEKKDTSFQGYFAFSSKIEQPYLFNSSAKGSLEFYFITESLFRVNINAYGVKTVYDFELPDYSLINLLKIYYNSEQYNLLISLVQNTDNDVRFNSLATIIGAEAGSNKPNDIFFPTDGYNVSLSLDLGTANTTNKINDPDLALALMTQFPDARVNTSQVAYFYKTLLSFSKFFPVGLDNSSTIGVKFKTGYIKTFSGNQDLIPPNKTFSAGGSNSVRGWRTHQLVPQDTVSFVGQIIPQNVLGGNLLVEGTFEYRQKIFGSFEYALFTDYGNTWKDLNKFRINTLALAIGFGFRYNTTIVPIRLDFGFKLFDPDSRKWIFKSVPFKTFEIQFGIGEAF